MIHFGGITPLKCVIIVLRKEVKGMKELKKINWKRVLFVIGLGVVLLVMFWLNNQLSNEFVETCTQQGFTRDYCISHT